MSKKLSALFADFIGENAMAGNFELLQDKNNSFFVINHDTGEKSCEDYFYNDCYTVTKAKEVLNTLKSEAKKMAYDVFNSIGNDWEETTPFWADNSDDAYEIQYIGTVFHVCPSGKFYTPWANSNVDIIEVSQDMIFYDELHKLLDAKGYWLENGEGDPCDLYICRSIATNAD